MDSGFGADDGYGVYSKPMFNRGEAQSVYRPKKDDGDAWGDADQQVGHVKCLLSLLRYSCACACACDVVVLVNFFFPRSRCTCFALVE